MDSKVLTTSAWRAADALRPEVRSRWIEALAAFSDAQRGRGVSAGLITNRIKHVRRFALHAHVSPWHVSSEDVQAWTESLGSLAPTTSATMRGSLRTFYRWGLADGRATSDPTQALGRDRLRLPTPEQWRPELVAFERQCFALGMLPSTVHSWGERLRTFARAQATRAPYDVTADDLYEWMAGKRWARETRRNTKSLLRTFYGWAVDTGRTDSDPTRALPKVKAGDPVARPATDDEYASALRAARDPRWHLALRLAAEMGLRRAEVVRIHTKDLRQDAAGRSLLTVHGKGAKIRVLPVPPSLAVILRELSPGYVFPGRMVEMQAHATSDGHLSPRYMGKRIAELLPPGITMHTLRHRFATRVYNVNRDLLSTQRLLGHSSPATTQRYVQISDEKMRALVEAVAW
ncbi:tyrosine-type recombinase/integrase [Microbacterium sp. MYb66]|uniref:tyrosine-type recombinase/integrase n=1 Tax=Microbacterium sp. MYb66 TaxID=1848692 RepID=UPI000D00709D|nr:tyrosine-type recombinase/integrase [Microbacterium sp. MYb66]PRA79715.1 hypothetical protein CQ045_14260 [Microbacterium sp. MYb66]